MDTPGSDADTRAWIPDDAWDEPEEPPSTRAKVIEAARAQRLEEGGLAVDAETLERVADTVMDPEYRWPGLYYTPEEAVDDVPDELVQRLRAYQDGRADVAGDLRAGWRDGCRVVFASFVGDLDEHRDALRAIAGDRVVVEPASRAAAELLALHERIADDRDALAEHGYEWMVLGGGDYEGHISVDVVGGASAADAEAFFRDRYGPAVAVDWLGPARERVQPHPFGSWADDGTILRLFFGLDHNGERFAGVSVAEQSAARVVVALTRWQPVGPTTLIGGFTREHADVELDAPLGGRKVIDASTGAERPHVGTYG